MASSFVGRDPLEIDRHVRVLETITFHAARYWPLEAALWDLAGKAKDVPTAQLLGERRTGLAAYASTADRRPAGARAESALALREQGFRALKVRIDKQHVERGPRRPSRRHATRSERTWRSWSTSTRAGACRGTSRRSLGAEAVDQVAARLREAGVLWLEEPLAGRGRGRTRPPACPRRAPHRRG